MIELLLNFLLQIVMTIGIIFLFGYLNSLCNKKFYENLGSRGKVVCYITGFIGTPVHECAHALFCLVFGHKITEIKLFQINSDDGTLGYVKHTYNPKNIYHKIGNFFIGVAPIIVISSLLFLLSWLIVPKMYGQIVMQIGDMNLSGGFLEILGGIVNSIFSIFNYVLTFRFWIFVFIGAFLALHMTLSSADIKSAISGLIFLLALFLVVDIILCIISVAVLEAFTRYVLIVGSFLFNFLILSLIISLILLLISFIVKLCVRK